jgi:hypothetical protein
MALALYLLFALLAFLAAERGVAPVGWRARAALAALPLALAGPALLAGRILAPIDLAWNSEPLAAARAAHGVSVVSSGALTDVYSQMIPWRAAVRFAWAHGEWPLWNPFVLAGDPLVASAVPAPFHPLHLLELLLPLGAGLTFVAAATLLVAALSAYLFARELEVGEGPAIFAAATWAYASDHLFWLEWPQALAVGIAPLVLLAARRAARRPGLASGLRLAIASALSLLAGHPETTLFVVALAALYFLVELATARPRRPLAALLTGIGGGLGGLALAAIALLPFLEALPLTAQHLFRHEVYAGMAKRAPWPEAALHLLRNALPMVYGAPGQHEVTRLPDLHAQAASAYAGSLALLAATAGALAAGTRQRERRPARRFFAATAIFGAAAGAKVPWLVDLGAALPLFDVALPEYFTVWAAIAVVPLAAFGIDALLEGAARERAESWAFGGAIAGVVAIGLLAPGRIAAGLPRPYFGLAAALWILPLVAAAFVVRHRRSAGWIAAIWTLLLVGQRAAELGPLWRSFPSAVFYPRVPPLDALPASASPYRTTAWGFEMVPNGSALWRLEDVRGYNAMTLRRMADVLPLWSREPGIWFNRVEDLGRPFLDFLGVRFAIVPAGAAAPRDWHPLAKTAGSALFENPRALPRAFAPERVILGGTAEERLRGMAAERRFAERAWIEPPGEPPGAAAGESRNPRGQVTVERDGTGYLLRTGFAKPAWVVVAETAWPGWRADCEGRELPLGFANQAFLAIAAPAGEHLIRLHYFPASFAIGRRVTGGALVLALGLGFWSRRRGPREPAG